jgi:hypothetical protein
MGNEIVIDEQTGKKYETKPEEKSDSILASVSMIPDGHPKSPTCGQVKIPHLTA